jgi:anaerobic selenocysteine-containing dehydrogenase
LIKRAFYGLVSVAESLIRFARAVDEVSRSTFVRDNCFKSRHVLEPDKRGKAMKQTRREFLKTVAAASSGATMLGYTGLLRKASADELAEIMKETKGYTYCDGCNHVPMCGITYFRRGEVITRLESRRDFNYPANTLCSKGYAQLQEQYHPARLRYPLKRTNPKGQPAKWVRISWDEAINTAAEKLNEVKKKYGADKVLFYTGDPKEMRPILQRLSYSFGSPNFATESSTCSRSVSLAGLLLFGLTMMGAPPGKETKNCFIWGVNQSYSRPTAMKGLIKAKAAGVKYFIVDPRKTPMVRVLDGEHLPLRPGTDGALALGMIHLAISENMYDKEFVDKWVQGFDELKEYVKTFTPERTEAITGVPADKIRGAARAFASGPTTALFSASPIVHHTNGNQNMRSVLTLFSITGNLDRPGGLVIPPPAVLPPYFIGHPVFCRRSDMLPKLQDQRSDRGFFPVWAELVPEVQANVLPEYVEKGRIKAMLIFGGNVKMWPQPDLYQRALAKMDFSLAADYFYRPWTHDSVDILLPAATCFERLAPHAVFGRKVYQRQPVKPLGEAREDWQIISDIGVALGLSDEFFGGDLEAVVNEYLKPVGTTLEKLSKAPGLTQTVPLSGTPKFEKFELGMLRKDKKPGFETPSGKVEVYSSILKKHGFDPLPTYKEPLESPQSKPELAKKYPLVLMTGARIPFYTHSKWREVPWVSEFQPEPIVNLHPSEAEKRGVKEGDKVVLENLHGRITVKVHLTEMVPPGMVDMFHGWAHQDVNVMLTRDFDPISGFPPYKSSLCEVRKVTA